MIDFFLLGMNRLLLRRWFCSTVSKNDWCVLQADNQTILGQYNTIHGNNNIIIGEHNTAYGNHVTMIGHGCVLYGSNSSLTGDHCKAYGNNNVISGKYTSSHTIQRSKNSVQTTLTQLFFGTPAND